MRNDKKGGLSMLSYEPLWNTMKNNYVMKTVENEFNLSDVEKTEYKQNYISGFWEFHIYSFIPLFAFAFSVIILLKSLLFFIS
mgnify:CR=1 FL=1